MLFDVVVLAYVDPTTGGVLLQLLLGGSAAYLVVIRLFRKRLRALFRRETAPKADD